MSRHIPAPRKHKVDPVGLALVQSNPNLPPASQLVPELGVHRDRARPHLLLGHGLRDDNVRGRDILPPERERLRDACRRESASRQSGAAYRVDLEHDGVQLLSRERQRLPRPVRLRHFLYHIK